MDCNARFIVVISAAAPSVKLGISVRIGGRGRRRAIRIAYRGCRGGIRRRRSRVGGADIGGGRCRRRCWTGRPFFPLAFGRAATGIGAKDRFYQIEPIIDNLYRRSLAIIKWPVLVIDKIRREEESRKKEEGFG